MSHGSITSQNQNRQNAKMSIGSKRLSAQTLLFQKVRQFYNIPLPKHLQKYKIRKNYNNASAQNRSQQLV